MKWALLLLLLTTPASAQQSVYPNLRIQYETCVMLASVEYRKQGQSKAAAVESAFRDCGTEEQAFMAAVALGMSGMDPSLVALSQAAAKMRLKQETITLLP